MDNGGPISKVIAAKLHISERLEFYSTLEHNDAFPPTWLSFVRDIIPAGFPELDNVILREPLKIYQLIHSEPKPFAGNLSESIAGLSSQLTTRTQTVPGLDSYAVPSIPISEKHGKDAVESAPPPSKKPKIGASPAAHQKPLKIVLKFNQ